MACRQLASEGGDAHAVLFLDADQAAAVGGRERPSWSSWVDHVVAQYLEGGAPGRILFGVTAIDHRERAVNCALDDDGSVRWCGTGLMLLPDAVWTLLKSQHPTPWYPDAGDAQGEGEDVVLTKRARALGVALEPVRDLTVWHQPRWRHPLVAYTPAAKDTARALDGLEVWTRQGTPVDGLVEG